MPAAKTPRSNLRKQWKLFFFSVLVLVLFFLLPRNQRWFYERAATYTKDLWWQKNRMNIEDRKRDRWENSYVYAKQISLMMPPNVFDSALVLVPGSEYFKSNGFAFAVPEPAVFYYYTGLKTTQPGNKLSRRANWYVTVQSAKLQLERVSSQEQLDSVIQQLTIPKE
jgi:hypothetical protein